MNADRGSARPPVYLASFASADPGAVPGRLIRRGNYLRRKGEHIPALFTTRLENLTPLSSMLQHAEAVFIMQPNPKTAALKVAEYRNKVAQFGRDPRSLKVIPGLMIFLGNTEKEANEKYEYWHSLADGEAALTFSASNCGKPPPGLGWRNRIDWVARGQLTGRFEGV